MVKLKTFLIICMMSIAINAFAAIPTRGVVYDVGLNYGGNTLSLIDFDTLRVDYDMNVIKNILRCNTVRIEGESLRRLSEAARIAGRYGLKILFNPWKMEVDRNATIEYMSQAAVTAEKLRNEGIDLVFVAGCEYSLFNKGASPGDTFEKRFNWLVSLGENPAEALSELNDANKKLNDILKDVSTAIRKRYKGPLTYSSGTWETVDWSLFDIVGVDYYRRGESDDDYLAGIQRYHIVGKPLYVMEFGCCTYKGAAARGGEGFAIFQGKDSSGNPIYEGGVVPERSESEQADYVADVLTLLDKGGVDGACVFVFSYPIYPYSTDGIDMDMISYSLVKSYPKTSSHWNQIPAWTPKELFYRLGRIYMEMENENVEK